MSNKITIHETAFVTAAFRAGDTGISKDHYAHLWANESIEEHAVRYSSTVSAYEPYAHCLRNRYFYDTLVDLIDHDEVEVLINFGCGFSMYPYLLNKDLIYIEIDKLDVITHKHQKITEWQEQGLLPYREVHYIAADFNMPSMEDLYHQIVPLKENKRSFILLEGVLFFLGKEDTNRLFNLFERLQGPDEYLASVSFQPQLEKSKVFHKLIEFVESNLEKNQQFQYQTVKDGYYKNRRGYKLIDHQDTFSLSAYYDPGRVLPNEEVLNEHMYLLKRNK